MDVERASAVTISRNATHLALDYTLMKNHRDASNKHRPTIEIPKKLQFFITNGNITQERINEAMAVTAKAVNAVLKITSPHTGVTSYSWRHSFCEEIVTKFTNAEGVVDENAVTQQTGHKNFSMSLAYGRPAHVRKNF